MTEGGSAGGGRQEEDVCVCRDAREKDRYGESVTEAGTREGSVLGEKEKKSQGCLSSTVRPLAGGKAAYVLFSLIYTEFLFKCH